MEKTRFRGVWRIAPGEYVVRYKKRDPKTGKVRDYRPKVSAKSAAAANNERARLMADAGATVARRTLAEYGKSWLAGKMPDLSPSTRRTYADQLTHTVDFRFADGRCFGDFYLDAIEHQDVIEYRDQSAKELHGKKRKVTRHDTINGRLRTLKNLYSDAVAILELPRNPTMRVKPLPKQAQRRERALEPAQLRALLEQLRAHDPIWHPLILTLGITAGRWSEITGLKRADLDYRGKGLRIVRRNLRGVIRGGTKSGGGIVRTLPMPDELADVLRAHLRRISQDPKLAREGWVFPSETGGPYKGGAGSIAKPLARAAAGIKLGRVVSAHDFRHTWNNILRQVADDEVQKAITGHSTDEMRMHYSHVSHGEKLEAMDAGLKLLKGGA